MDVNDNKPVFTRSRYVAEIMEEQPGENVLNKLIEMVRTGNSFDIYFISKHKYVLYAVLV